MAVVLFLSVKCNLFSVYLAWFGLVVVIKVRTMPRAEKDTLPITAELFIKDDLNYFGEFFYIGNVCDMFHPN